MAATANQEPADQVAALKQQHRATWAAGDYAAVAQRIWEVGARIVQRVGVAPGEDVLDVACGTGNAAIPAAQAGAQVTAVDLTAELFDAARAIAQEAGVQVDWIEGDAEALPLGDASFDVVLSTFGCMFAPRHEVVAHELARVLRPGGRLGLCNWTPDGAIGGFFATIGKHLPPPPPFALPPPLWGNEDHVQHLFDGTGINLDFHRETVEFIFDSVSDIFEFYATNFGPVIKARERLEPDGRWPALRDDLLVYFERNTTPVGDAILWPAEYLVVLGRAPS